MSWSNFPENWEKDVPEIKILDEDKIPKKIKIGETYHTSWQSNTRFKWTLISHGDIYAKLKNKFNGKEFDCKITDLRETNYNARNNAKSRIKKLKQ